MKILSTLSTKQVVVENIQGIFNGTGAVVVSHQGRSNTAQLQRVINSTGMRGLQLPFAQESESLEEAMRRMRSLDRRAVVVGHMGPDYRLYMNRSVLDAYQKGIKECAGIRSFPGAPVAVFGSEAEDRDTGLFKLSPDLFKRQSTDYALLFEPGADDLSVEVLTRTDELAQSILTTARLCECMHGHDYSEPPPVHGTLCEHDDTEIKCS